MINTIGTFSAIWLVLWIILSILFVIIYPLVRSHLLKLHPRFGSALLLAYWMGPFLASLLSTVILFLPTAETLLVDSHCHDNCQSHVPMLDSAGLAWFGTIVGSIAVISLLVQLLTTMRHARQLRSQFNFLGKSFGSYYTINSSCPLVFTLGWWTPRIYVSDGLLNACSDADMEIILLHERAHKERRDNLRLLIARLCSAVLFRPLAKRMQVDLQLLTEEACDFKAAEKYGHVAVAETLLKVKKLLLKNPAPVPYTAMAFAEREVEVRIMALLKAGGCISLKSWQLALLLVSAIMMLLLTVSPLHHGSEWVISLLTSSHSHIL